MFSLSAGKWPASTAKVPSQIALLVVVVLLCGCASKGPVAPNANLYASNVQSRYAGHSPRPFVEIEDDGREAQLPPRKRSDPLSDDPTEPFSPNYGSATPVPVPSQWTVTIVRERA